MRALVTGASKGFGRALASSLIQEGYTVYSGVRDIKSAPPGTRPLHLDLLDESSIHSAVNTILKEVGGLDLLIHNAGIAYWGAVDSMHLHEVKDLFEVNFFAPFRLTQLLLPSMREQKSGNIVFISSIRAVESCAYMGMYSASKASLEAMAFDLSVTLQKWNISVSVVEPGPLDTNIKIQHGSYFQEENPYLPYGDVTLEWQSVEEACKAVLCHLTNPHPPFRFQTSNHAQAIVAKHLTDFSGKSWHTEQKEWVNASSLTATHS